ncbi:coiled-coil domain-containing protein 192 [Physeter macrocephalus]|uniref:Coiled-coil domain-containing protein 192 n=1 Tax=Physeter macrocephalus TaxID=9755 RepID=A0A9W2WUR5_PHYMC|nr:coiled-coil domain-containing protein 192 [Physeter catodon]
MVLSQALFLDPVIMLSYYLSPYLFRSRKLPHHRAGAAAGTLHDRCSRLLETFNCLKLTHVKLLLSLPSLPNPTATSLSSATLSGPWPWQADFLWGADPCQCSKLDAGEVLLKGVTVTASQREGPLYLKESLETRQMVFTLAQLEAFEICLKEAEEKAKVLSEQLAASEGTKSKLLEQVSWLEKKLEALDRKEDRGEPYEKMVLAKDQCIEKLQAEVKASQEQLVAYKLKHKRKLEKLQTDLATAKQEAAITVLELNEKILTLCEGKPAPREDSSLEECCGGLLPVEEGDRKINLIVELSTQVSHQTEKITQLEEILEEKERKIQQLEAEREAHPFPEVKDSPECLQEAPIFFNNSITPVVYGEDI